MKRLIGIIGLISILSLGCTKNSNPTVPQTASAQSIVAVSISYDYTAGNMGLYSISDTTAYKNLLSIWEDNDIRTYNGAMYVLERFGKDNLLKINGSIINDSTVAYEKNIGASVNIQDIAIISSTKAYVTQYASAQLAIVNPTTGIKSGTIDLSAFNSRTPYSATVPYMGRELYYNGKVYVVCQRLAVPTGGTYESASDTSEIAVINSSSDSVIKTIKLIYKNPQELSICNGKLYVASVGVWGVSDAGIEEIDLSTDTDIGSIISETTLTGDLTSFIVISDSKGYAVISDLATGMTSTLYSFNPQTKTVGAKIAGIDAPCSGHIAYDGTYVYVGDRSNTTPGIVVVNPLTDAKVGTTKNVGLPPNSLALLETTK